jgi:hypothetical protein
MILYSGGSTSSGDNAFDVWPSSRKWRVQVAHQSRVYGSLQSIRYYLRNQKRKMKMVRTCGKNVRRKNSEECV